MPVPTSPQDLINIIREKLFNNTSGLIEEPDLREVLENIVKVLDAKFSMFSPNLTEEQYAQWNLILDYMLRETKGVLTTSSPAPTGNAAIGKYLLSGAGTYTNLGGLVATADKLNYAYFDGTTWSKVSVTLPETILSTVLAPTDITEATTGKSVADYIETQKSNYLGFNTILLTPTITNGKALTASQNSLYTNVVSLKMVDSTEWNVFKYERIFNPNERFELKFNSLHRSLIYFANSGKLIQKIALTTEQLNSRKVNLEIPKGTNEIYFAVGDSSLGLTELKLITNQELKDASEYFYLSGNNKLGNYTAQQKFDRNGNTIVGGNNSHTVKFLNVGSGKLFTYGVNISSFGGFFFYDSNKRLIGKVLRDDLDYNVDPISGKWDLRHSIDVPLGAKYVSFDNDGVFYSKIDGTLVFDTPIQNARIWQDFDVLNRDMEAETVESVADYIETQKSNYLGFDTILLTPTITNGKALTATQNSIYTNVVYFRMIDSAGRNAFKYERIFNPNERVELKFHLLHGNIIYFANSGKLIQKITLTTEQVNSGKVTLEIPKGTNEIYFAVDDISLGLTELKLITNQELKDASEYFYLSGDNKLANYTAQQKFDRNGNIIPGGVSSHTVKFLNVESGKLFTYGVNISSFGGFFFYDSNKRLIGKVLRDDLVFNADPISGKWDLRHSVDVPLGAKYVSFDNDGVFYSKIDGTLVFDTPIQNARIWQDFDVLKRDFDVVNPVEISSNILTQKNISNSFLEEGSNILNKSKKLIIKNKSLTGVGRIAFRFRFQEDVNNENAERKLVEITDKNGDNYFNFVVRKNLTSALQGSDDPALSPSIITTYPIPKFNSGFGVRTNLPGVDVTRQNMNYEDRAINVTAPTNIVNQYKPLVGNDLFYVRFNSTNQELLNEWKDLKLKTTVSSISLTSVSKGLSIVSNYAEFQTMRDLFFDFETKINNTILAPYVELVQIFLGGRKPTETSMQTRYEKNDLWIEPTDILQMEVPLISVYANQSAPTTGILDSFPAYVSRAVDRSWHTFEFISSQEIDTALFTIDGQWLSDKGNVNFPSIRKAFTNGGFIKIGSEIGIDVKDLVVQFDHYTDVETRESPASHIFCSNYHPSIIHFFGHDIYYCEDKNIPENEIITKYHLYESEGGFIPDSLKPADPDYKGDDAIPNYRKHLAHPSWKLEMILSWLKDAGYVNISHRDLSDWVRNGKQLPSNKCYLFDFDDNPTYMYENNEIKSIFRRNGCKPAFALELGFYVTEDTPTTLYNPKEEIAYFKDTNEHRIKLQKRLQTMQHEGWEMVLHGPDRGLYHKAISYDTLKDKVIGSIKIAEKIGIENAFWCLASGGVSPNSIKLHDYLGLKISTATHGTYVGLCHHPNHSPRYTFEPFHSPGAPNADRDRKEKIISYNFK